MGRKWGGAARGAGAVGKTEKEKEHIDLDWEAA